MVTAGSPKKILFYAGLALLLASGGLAATAGLKLPLAEAREELTEKSSEVFSCELAGRDEKNCQESRLHQNSGPNAGEQTECGSVPRPFPGARLTII